MRAAAFPFLFSLSVGAFHGFLARIRTGFRREDIQQPFRKSGFPSCPFLFQGGIPMGDRHGKRRTVQPVQDGGGELPAKGRALEYRSRSVVDVGHPVNHALFVFPEYGDDAFFGQEPEESLTGVLTQGFPDGLLCAFLYGMCLHPRLAPGAFPFQGLVTDAPADVAGLDAHATASALLIECRIDQPVACPSVDTLAYFFHRHVEESEQGLEFPE